MVYPEFHSNVTNRWARVTWRPRLPQIVLTSRCPISPWSHYYSLSWASVRKQVKLYELLSFTIVREHRFLGSETSIWPRLMASKRRQLSYSASSQNLSCSKHLWCARGMSWASKTTLPDTWRWFILSFIQMWCIDPEHVSLEDPVCHK